MKQHCSLVFYLILVCAFIVMPCLGQGANNPIYNLSFNPLSAYEDISSNEVRRIMQDSKGYIWIATNTGLCRYDGYRIRTYKDNLFTPGLLTNNSIKCFAEDQNHQLWIGTRKGLNRLDLKTGDVKKIEIADLKDQEIGALHVDQYNNVWVATTGRLYYFDSSPDSRLIPVSSLSGGENVIGVSTLMTDSEGRMWIGTWANGLFRYDYKSDRFLSYPALNKRNSVHVLFEDSHKTIWIGSWAEGLYRMEGMDTPEKASWARFVHNSSDPNSLSDNIIYCMEEDLTNNALWIGTRNGLSILDLKEKNSTFVNYLPENTRFPLPYNELNSIIRDRSGIMWLGMLGGGVYFADMRPNPFRKGNMEPIRHLLYSNSVRSLFIDKDEVLWLGVGSHGLAMQEKGKTPVYLLDHPDFKGFKAFHTINSIIQRRKTHELFFATWGNGIFIYDKEKPVGKRVSQLTYENSPWLPSSNIIVSLFEDREENVWIGFLGGVVVYTKDEMPLVLTELLEDASVLENVSINSITQSVSGDIWLGGDVGLYRLRGPLVKGSLECNSYTMKTNNLLYDNIQCVYEDTHGNLWAGSEGGGLLLYDKEKDKFVSVNARFGILADAILNILEDDMGNLWLSSNNGLIKLQISEDAQIAVSSTYTTTDGLSSNSFLRNAGAKAKDGELFFGSHNGYDRFYPDKLQESEFAPEVVITDILVFNKSLSEYDPQVRSRMSLDAADYTQKLTLKHDQNHFQIEFSALSYANPSKNKYAYRLEGYDAEWQYVGASNRVANYNNLQSGTYYFHLKGSNENGQWNEKSEILQIDILPPPWMTAKAYALYFLLFVLLVWFSYRIIRNRIKLRERIHLQEIEQAKTEEVNHAKLQFFTNITHEILTPLTILSASVDELKMENPKSGESYSVMGTNINRLIRLVQQILEFRKSESGSLKLKVSEGDLVGFVKKAIDAFRPLIKKKDLTITFSSSQKEIVGYFDPDKLDKIVYNLLSNASKYNKVGGEINITVSFDKEAEEAVISVRDTGEGFSDEEKTGLFQRFYEGNYRRHNTIGTGIGLSLTKDLVDLHQGKIDVNSRKGEGAEFVISIPINRQTYADEQIDDMMPTEAEEFIPEALPEQEKQYTLLLVEDNEELLTLMVRLLEREYDIVTATDGKQAVEIISTHEIDLIVSDVMMPEMDGIELCKYIKGEFDYCHIPVLLLTAKNTEEDRIEAYESGADGFLNKPFNASLLHVRIKNLLKKQDRMARDFKKQLVFEVQDLDYTSMDEEFLQRAIAIVQNHLDDSAFDQQQFIDEMGTSKSTLYKKLKSLTGLNTSAFIRNVRLKAACQLLEEKRSIRISELAYAVGFNDPKYFSACFRKEFGMLPKEYLQKLYPNDERGEF